MDLQMNGKTALVTGGSAGIGKAIAFALAREGVDVAICARRKQPLEAAASQIARETNRKIVAIPADLTKPADAEAFVKDAHTALGRIDILVNNAGSAPGGVLDFLTEEHWAQSLQLKFMGYVRCLKHVLPIIGHLGAANWVTFAIGATALALLYIFETRAPRAPAPLMIMAAGILVVSVLRLAHEHGVHVVGVIDGPGCLDSFRGRIS
jgi:NAD(P)-dependent dehydrogenase (short-subunit alcohol dehydrogenase family)